MIFSYVEFILSKNGSQNTFLYQPTLDGLVL